MSGTTGIKLLLVEPDGTALQVCRKSIVRFFPACTVHVALNAEQASALFARYLHDIVISATGTPREDWIKLARQICATKSDAVVVLMTSDSTQSLGTFETEAEQLCLSGVLHKPLDVKRLLLAVKKALDTVESRRRGAAEGQNGSR